MNSGTGLPFVLSIDPTDVAEICRQPLGMILALITGPKHKYWHYRIPPPAVCFLTKASVPRTT